MIITKKGFCFVLFLNDSLFAVFFFFFFFYEMKNRQKSKIKRLKKRKREKEKEKKEEGGKEVKEREQAVIEER